MQRFPSYKDVSEVENALIKDGIPVKLLFNYIIQILRRLETEIGIINISNVKKYISSNPRIKYLSLEEDFLLTLIEENPKFFKLKALKSFDGKDVQLIIPNYNILDYQLPIRKKFHSYKYYESYKSYEDILNVNIKNILLL
jgi:hypothetical protein